MTTIVFDVPRPATVEIVIYDALGREVCALERGLVPAGRYMTTWDGRDRNGRDVGAGLYFCRLKAGNFTKTQKMSLVR
jgi:flagellar hook assembly protein FlgD